MTLLRRMLWLVVRLALKGLVWIFAILARLMISSFLAVFRFLLNLVTTSFYALVHGPKRYMEWLAGKWAQKLLENGVSRDYIDQIYGLCQALAFTKIALGLVVAALFTVAILRIVFGNSV